MHIDAHQHFWRYHSSGYPWIPPGSDLARDWLPDDLVPLRKACGIHASVAVQARQSLAETHWLLGLADARADIHGVVGWVDLRAPDLPGQLAALAAHPRLIGMRHVAQDEPDDRFLARPEVLRGVRELHAFGFTYDILIYERQLPAAIELVRACPGQPFILDHIAKPRIAARHLQPWADRIRELARHPNVTCKVSGLVTEADHHAWTPDDLQPYLDVVSEAFGPDRLLFGSDWPVCLLAASYERVHAVVASHFSRLDSADRDAVFGGNAARVYSRKLP